jgi:CRISPR-associated protein Cas1
VRKLQNTLFVTTQGAYLAKEGESLVVRAEKEKKFQIPVRNLDGVVCFGQVSVSPFLLGMCAEHDVSVSFLTENGRFLAKAVGSPSGNVTLRRNQYRMADDTDQSLSISRSVLSGKLVNSRTLLRRVARDREDADAESLNRAADSLGAVLRRLQEANDLDDIRGFEGDAARTYFGVFEHLLASGEEAFRFTGRNRRPPLDPVNCLLSFVYTLLLHDIRSSLESVGLDPEVGFLHRDRPGRPSLALDLLEEFRPAVADRLVLSLINRGQVKPAGFESSGSGAVTMDEETRKEVLVAYQKRKQQEMEHPFLKEKMPLGLFPFAQALLLARYIRGDLEGYPPYLWRS